ncbi:acyltransferase family protein [Shewanella sp. SG41-3]|uniref:acyltransferase family protein n=1 Tax=Shewanella sp. SG41-3 TaxID=2760977 RepID=UPI001601CD06|nr:acyltransferase family protein [Shewanella sp. SG41-3]MBB1474347.1 acyltransferase [Shewanella sp. SG41-3]
MQFRKDINGLRAIAVVAVVVFHFNASWMPGGFAGVDVFFVISGFLMTGIIFRGVDRREFSLIKFYIARANRIIPALAFLCLVLLAFGWYFLTSTDYMNLGKHVASSIAFISNVTYWTESSYFDSSSQEKWLLHTWSLSAEWQFYIIYPLAIVVLRKMLSDNVLKIGIVLGTVIGFLFCVVATYKWPSSAYYLLPTRTWEMMIGGVAYLYPFSLPQKRKKWLEWGGLVLIVGSYLLITKDSPWPGYLAIFPVLGSFLIIQAQRNNSFITSNIISQKLGAWSYSIYLWHWPIVVLIYYFSLKIYFVYIGILLSIFIGFLSHKYIEKQNFKKDYHRLLDYLYCLPIQMLLVVMLLSGYIYISGGIDTSFRRGASTPQAVFLEKYEQQHRNLDDTYWLKCNSYTSLTEKNELSIDDSCLNENNLGGVLLWGDSHAEALSLGLRTILQPLNISFNQVTSASCRVSLNKADNLKGNIKKACDFSNQLALNSISELKPRLVIIAQQKEHEKTDWIEVFDALKSRGVENVILVGPVSQWKPSLPKVMIKSQNWLKNEIFITDDGLDLSIIETDNVMKKHSYPKGLKYVSLVDDVCMKKEGVFYCRVILDNNELIQVDYGHLSKDGSIFVVKSILSGHILPIFNEGSDYITFN